MVIGHDQNQTDKRDLQEIYRAANASNAQERHLNERANLVREALVAFISQKLAVPETERPLIDAFITESCSDIAEKVTDRILRRLPIRAALAAGDELTDYIKQQTRLQYDAILDRLPVNTLAAKLDRAGTEPKFEERARAVIEERVRIMIREKVVVRRAVNDAFKRVR